MPTLRPMLRWTDRSSCEQFWCGIGRLGESRRTKPSSRFGRVSRTINRCNPNNPNNRIRSYINQHVVMSGWLGPGDGDSGVAEAAASSAARP